MSIQELQTQIDKIQRARDTINQRIVSLFEREQELTAQIAQNWQNAASLKFGNPPNLNGAKLKIKMKLLREKALETTRAQMNEFLDMETRLANKQMGYQRRLDQLTIEQMSSTLASASARAEEERNRLIRELEQELNNSPQEERNRLLDEARREVAERNAADAAATTSAAPATDNNSNVEPNTWCNKLGRCFRRWTKRNKNKNKNKKNGGARKKNKSMKARRRN